MNQNAPIEERPATRARQETAVPRPGPVALSPESRALLRVLTEGDMALARRKDLGELLRRLQASASPAEGTVPSDRLDRLEGSLNRIDGALRIELAPILKAAVAEGMAADRTRPVRRNRGVVLLFLAGLTLGIMGGPAIKEGGQKTLQAGLPVIIDFLPQNWGIRNSGNQFE
jgi:hypothetical protein